jgi:hypothetical protein
MALMGRPSLSSIDRTAIWRDTIGPK